MNGVRIRQLIPAVLGILLLGSFAMCGRFAERRQLPPQGMSIALANTPEPTNTAVPSPIPLMDLSPTPSPVEVVEIAEDAPSPPPAPTSTTATTVFLGSPELKIGIYLPDFPPERNLLAFEEVVGRRMDIVTWYQFWSYTLVTAKLRSVCARSSIPLIKWEPWAGRGQDNPYTLESIASGKHDPLIRNWVTQVSQICQSQTVLVSFAHEMNTKPGVVSWYPWQGDPASYIAAWKRVVSIGREVAPNIKWVWAPAWGNEDAILYWPGDEYVDYIGLTVLNFWRRKIDIRFKWWQWRSFAQLYEPQRSFLLAFGKPVIIAEVASGEGPGSDDKARWIQEMFDDLRTNYKEVVGVVWFNAEHAREFPDIEWRLDSSPESLQAFRKAVGTTAMAAATARPTASPTSPLPSPTLEPTATPMPTSTPTAMAAETQTAIPTSTQSPTPTATSGPTVTATPTPSPTREERKEVYYVIKEGDQLCKIAQSFYGDWRQWRTIYEANRGIIQNPNLIYPDQVLIIPK